MRGGWRRAARVSRALLIFCRCLPNLNILKINKQNCILSCAWHNRVLFRCLSWLSTGSCVVTKRCWAWCRYSLLVRYICLKHLDRIQGNLQKVSQIDVFLWAGINHGALNCWGKKEIKQFTVKSILVFVAMCTCRPASSQSTRADSWALQRLRELWLWQELRRSWCSSGFNRTKGFHLNHKTRTEGCYCYCRHTHRSTFLWFSGKSA